MAKRRKTDVAFYDGLATKANLNACYLGSKKASTMTIFGSTNRYQLEAFFCATSML